MPLLLALAVPALEPVDAAAGVDQLLLARVEGMALAAQLDPQVGLGGTGGEGVATRATHAGDLVVGVDASLHDDLQGCSGRNCASLWPAHSPSNTARPSLIPRRSRRHRGRRRAVGPRAVGANPDAHRDA